MTTLTAVRSLDTEPLVAAISAGDDAGAEAIYLGFGVCSHVRLATGELPFDALAMVLVAEEQRRMWGASRVVHLIADAHAIAAGHDPIAVSAVAGRLARGLRRAVGRLGFDRYDVILASTLDDDLHRALLAFAVGQRADGYAAREAADIEWARRTYGAGVKVGWTMDGDARRIPRFDERHFDAVHAALFGSAPTAVYTQPGRTADGRRPRCSPYTALPDQQRPLLTSSDADLRATVWSRSQTRQLAAICHSAERALGIHARQPELPARLAVVRDALA
jgi:hypothetical protein